MPDYKNKDQKAQVWEELQGLVTAPKGINLSEKDLKPVVEDIVKAIHFWPKSECN